jgi:hypothetical protein
MHCKDTRECKVVRACQANSKNDSCFLGHGPFTNSMQQTACACKKADAQHLDVCGSSNARTTDVAPSIACTQTTAQTRQSSCHVPNQTRLFSAARQHCSLRRAVSAPGTRVTKEETAPTSLQVCTHQHAASSSADNLAYFRKSPSSCPAALCSTQGATEPHQKGFYHPPLRICMSYSNRSGPITCHMHTCMHET